MTSARLNIFGLRQRVALLARWHSSAETCRSVNRLYCYACRMCI